VFAIPQKSLRHSPRIFFAIFFKKIPVYSSRKSSRHSSHQSYLPARQASRHTREGGYLIHTTKNFIDFHKISDIVVDEKRRQLRKN
jgi:hypothetical protein